MTTISLKYNERNVMAQKAIDYIMSLGFFSRVDEPSVERRKTLKAIADVRAGKDVTRCDSFEDYLKEIAS